MKSCLLRIVKIEKNLNGDIPQFVLKDDKLPRERRIKRMCSYWDYFLLHIIKNLFRDSACRCMRNRFYASFRMAANALLSYREMSKTVTHQKQNKKCCFGKNLSNWNPTSWHYLNLYVYCVSFIARHFLLWKLTSAKSNFESMFQQERNQNNVYGVGSPKHMAI